MGELLIFSALLLVMSAVDLKAMLQSNLKKEILPYSVLILVTGTVGLLYFLNPYRTSITAMFLNIFGIKG